jgi:hypothetical protein
MRSLKAAGDSFTQSIQTKTGRHCWCAARFCFEGAFPCWLQSTSVTTKATIPERYFPACFFASSARAPARIPVSAMLPS